MKSYPDVDAYLSDATTWRAEMQALRAMMLDSELAESIKWGKPCFAFDDSNIAIIQPFNDFVALMFFKGALLKDPQGLLEPPGPNSRVARRAPFKSMADVLAMEGSLRDFVKQAVEAEKAGLEVPTDDELELVEELRTRLEANRKLKTAFESLTPGRQRAYNLYLSDAKQSQTRTSRIEKCVPQILAGKGLRDR